MSACKVYSIKGPPAAEESPRSSLWLARLPGLSTSIVAELRKLSEAGSRPWQAYLMLCTIDPWRQKQLNVCASQVTRPPDSYRWPWKSADTTHSRTSLLCLLPLDSKCRHLEAHGGIYRLASVVHTDQGARAEEDARVAQCGVVVDSPRWGSGISNVRSTKYTVALNHSPPPPVPARFSSPSNGKQNARNSPFPFLLFIVEKSVRIVSDWLID